MSEMILKWCENRRLEGWRYVCSTKVGVSYPDYLPAPFRSLIYENRRFWMFRSPEDRDKFCHEHNFQEHGIRVVDVPQEPYQVLVYYRYSVPRKPNPQTRLIVFSSELDDLRKDPNVLGLYRLAEIT